VPRWAAILRNVTVSERFISGSQTVLRFLAKLFLVSAGCISAGISIGTVAHFLGAAPFGYGLGREAFQLAWFEGGIPGDALGVLVDVPYGNKRRKVALSPGYDRYTSAVRNATALKLSAPSFAEALIGVSMMLHANVFGFLLAPLMLIAFVSLIAAVAIASKNHEQTSRNTWTWLALAAVAQILTFMALASVGKGT